MIIPPDKQLVRELTDLVQTLYLLRYKTKVCLNCLANFLLKKNRSFKKNRSLALSALLQFHLFSIRVIFRGSEKIYSSTFGDTILDSQKVFHVQFLFNIQFYILDIAEREFEQGKIAKKKFFQNFDVFSLLIPSWLSNNTGHNVQ